jgi:Ca2+-binding EF-hand superfamily protein
MAARGTGALRGVNEENDAKVTGAEEVPIEVFKSLDRAGNGFMSAAELSHAMPHWGEKLTNEEVDEVISTAYVDDDGQTVCLVKGSRERTV